MIWRRWSWRVEHGLGAPSERSVRFQIRPAVPCWVMDVKPGDPMHRVTRVDAGADTIIESTSGGLWRKRRILKMHIGVGLDAYLKHDGRGCLSCTFWLLTNAKDPPFIGPACRELLPYDDIGFEPPS